MESKEILKIAHFVKHHCKPNPTSATFSKTVWEEFLKNYQLDINQIEFIKCLRILFVYIHEGNIDVYTKRVKNKSKKFLLGLELISAATSTPSGLSWNLLNPKPKKKE